MAVFYIHHEKRNQFVRIHDGFTIGRGEGDLILQDDARVSRAHCRFHLIGEEVLIEDLDSANSTQVNRIAVIPHRRRRLQCGDVIRLGGQRFVVTDQNVRAPGPSEELTRCAGRLESQTRQIRLERSVGLTSIGLGLPDPVPYTEVVALLDAQKPRSRVMVLASSEARNALDFRTRGRLELAMGLVSVLIGVGVLLQAYVRSTL
jgi:pSer/pThr/pTyr-binding forkhead associated (FHA) protein